MKYIIKNCPAIYGNEYCKENTYEDGSIHCQDCTDCLLKQIVEKCLTKYCDDDFGHGKFVMANQILQLLDIQEISE